jgi:hypothetical protein
MAPWLYQLPYDNERDFVGIGLQLIDGGMSYHDTFASESRNGHGRLDGQFDGIGKIARNHAVTVAGLRPEIYDRYNIPRKSH